MLKIELRGLRTEAERFGGGFKKDSRSGDYTMWSDAEYRANKICWSVEYGVRLSMESRVTPLFLAWTTRRMEFTSTETGENRRKCLGR